MAHTSLAHISTLCLWVFVESPLPLSVPSPVSLFRNRPILNSPLFPGLLWDPFYGKPGKWGWWGHLATGVVIGNKSEETFPGKGCMLGRAWWAGRPPLGPASLWRRWMNWVDTPMGKTLSFLHQVFAVWPVSLPSSWPAGGVGILKWEFNHVCHLPQPLKWSSFSQNEIQLLVYLWKPHVTWLPPSTPGWLASIPSILLPFGPPFDPSVTSDPWTQCPPARSKRRVPRVLRSTRLLPWGRSSDTLFLLSGTFSCSTLAG